MQATICEPTSHPSLEPNRLAGQTVVTIWIPRFASGFQKQDFPLSPASVMFIVWTPGEAAMSNPTQPNIRLINTPDYREGYANSVQVRVSVWDFLLIFGRIQPQVSGDVEVQNFQG